MAGAIAAAVDAALDNDDGEDDVVVVVSSDNKSRDYRTAVDRESTSEEFEVCPAAK